MKNIFEKNNKAIVLLIIIIIIVIAVTIIVGINIYNHLKGKDTNMVEKEQVINHISTEDMKERAPLINMNDTENAKIQNGEKINSSQNLKKEKELSGLKLTNISLRTKSGLSYFNATVENTTDKDFERRVVNLIFKKSDGSILTTVEALIPAIKANGSTTINASTTEDIVNANDVEIEFI